jgi:hypothetical protein
LHNSLNDVEHFDFHLQVFNVQARNNDFAQNIYQQHVSQVSRLRMLLCHSGNRTHLENCFNAKEAFEHQVLIRNITNTIRIQEKCWIPQKFLVVDLFNTVQQQLKPILSRKLIDPLFRAGDERHTKVSH